MSVGACVVLCFTFSYIVVVKLSDGTIVIVSVASVDKQLLGTEATQALRKMGVTSKICGLSANDLRDVFVDSGADDFILKPMPCKAAELKRTLNRILARRRRSHVHLDSQS